MRRKLFLILAVSALCMNAAEAPIWRTNSERSSLLKTPSVTEMFKKRSGSKAALPGYDHSNAVVKMNITQLALLNLSFQGEFAFHHKMSFALGFSWLMTRPLFSSVYNELPNFSPPKLSGFALTPEFRFYPGGDVDKPAPRGFYLAPYLRYAKYKVTQTVSYTEDPPVSKTHSAEASSTYAGTNGGLMIGYQWVIKEHFSIDLWIIGFGYGKAKYTYSWRAPEANLSAAEQQDVKELAEEYFDSFSLFGWNGTITTTSSSVTATVKGLPMYSMRILGLCFGYAF